jgi:tetratricopeptide (TPR) repeat protein
MSKVVKFPIPTPEKFGPLRARKKENTRLEKHGQLNLFTGGKLIRLHKLSAIEEALLIDEQGDKLEAKKLYLKAIEGGDSLADAYCNLGIIEWEEGNQTKAIDYFTLALSHDPRHFEAHYNLANLYGEIGNYGLAKAHYNISIEIEPSFPNNYFNLGLILAINKEFVEAVNVLNKYRELTPPAEQSDADSLIKKILGAI